MKRLYLSRKTSRINELIESGIRLSDVETYVQRLLPIEYFADLRAKFLVEIESALRASGVWETDGAAIRLVVGTSHKHYPAQLLMSHLGIRQRAGELLFEQLQPIFVDSSDRRWFFGTFITDVGNSLESAPQVELGRLHRDVRKMLALLRMHAIGVTELQLARYPLHGHGRTIQAHAHVIGYVDDRLFNPTKAAAAIAERNTLSNWLGAPVAKFELIHTCRKLAFRCDYLFKAPTEESWLEAHLNIPSGFRTRSHGSVNRWGALRLSQILSRMTLRNATFAHGELVKVKGDWIRNTTVWLRQQRIIPDLDDESGYERIWARGPLGDQSAAPVIHTNAIEPVDAAWRDAMRNKFDQVAENRRGYERRHELRSADLQEKCLASPVRPKTKS